MKVYIHMRKLPVFTIGMIIVMIVAISILRTRTPKKDCCKSPQRGVPEDDVPKSPASPASAGTSLWGDGTAGPLGHMFFVDTH